MSHLSKHVFQRALPKAAAKGWFLLLLIPAVGSAQSFRQVYRVTLDIANDSGVSIASDRKGGCIAAGTAYSSTTFEDLTVIHAGSDGRVSWTYRAVTPAESERAVDIKSGPNGTVYVLSVMSSQASGQGFRLTRLSRAGTELSRTSVPNSRQYSSFYGDCRMAMTKSGEVYAFGNSGMTEHLVKFNSDGTLDWDHTLSGAVPQADGADLLIDSLGAIYSVSPEQGQGYVFRKFQPNGAQVWQSNFFGHHGAVLGRGMLQQAPNGDILACVSPETSFGVPMFSLLRIDSGLGTILWNRPYSTVHTADAEAGGFAADSQGLMFVSSFSLGGGQSGSRVSRFDAAGNLLNDSFTAGSSGRNTGLVSMKNGVLLWRSLASGTLIRYRNPLSVISSRTQSAEQYSRVIVDDDGDMFCVGTASQNFLILKFSGQEVRN